MKTLIAPSILSADLARLGEDIDQVLKAGADIIHFDVMDNHYVPNLTFGPDILKALKNYGITAEFDVHLMVEPVDQLIQSFAQAGANWISFHPEASRHTARSISLIKQMGCKAGVALNPATPLSVLDDIIHELDFVLIMSVNPGFGGQAFIQHSLDKIRRLKQKIDQLNLSVQIEVDGGVKIDNIQPIAQAGASIFVAGSAIFGSSNYQTTITAMREQIQN